MEKWSKPGEHSTQEKDSGPAVVGANWYRFRPGQYLVNPHVMSVSFIWIVRGGGRIKSGDYSFQVKANHVVRLPWHHRVEYQADSQNPFHIGTLHLVPEHSRDAPVFPTVAHQAGDPLLRDPRRSGDSRAFPPSVATFGSGPARRIADLGRFAAERFTDSIFDEKVSRSLGELIMAENALWGEARDRAVLPVALDAMMTHARTNLASPLSVREMAMVGDVSVTSAQRLFNAHTGMTLRNWVRQIRLQEAAHLLQSSGLRVSEVSKLVGFSDPLYFSRVFSEEHGVPPSRYAQIELRP
jgi:AraC-like DNA-binding protein